MTFEKSETTVAESRSVENSPIKPSFISQIEMVFAKRLPADVDIEAFVEKIIDTYMESSQHKKYNDDFFLDIIKPVMIQIIRLKDGLEKDQCTFKDILAKNDVLKALSFAQDIFNGFEEEFTDILEYYDVIPFKAENNKFNPLKQTVVKTIPTTDETLFKIVSESVGCGYERHERIVRKERVAAYVIEKAEQEV
ncbi:MAG: nucleotide exchange factor GrpE [Nitrososphaerota archaeon]|nr:nucleotide exchange factor GrpE [Nitrososphaerota archaeon]